MTLAVYGLQDRMNIYIIEYQSLRKSRDKFKLLLQKEEEEFEEDVVVAKKKGLPLGNYVTNCTKCQITCHRLCGLKKEKFACDVMLSKSGADRWKTFCSAIDKHRCFANDSKSFLFTFTPET